MRASRERLGMFSRVKTMEPLTTPCSVVIPEDTRVVSKGMVGTATVGVMAAALVAKYYLSKSRKYYDSANASGEEHSKSSRFWKKGFF